MKSAFALFLAVLFFASCFAQRRSNDNNYRRGTYDDYMAKSRRLMTPGFILLGSGAAMLTGGIILFAQGTNEYNNSDQSSINSKQIVGYVLICTGTICTLGSIPLIVIGSHMHRKAMRANAILEMEKVPGEKITGIPLRPYPALGLAINLGH
ncbi:MAG: hypothetical protein JST47_15405 [Bacteroidetes bacterium]|nr:hypothetical protein [Bacteroidota bacterium]MBS1974283.1 hypothetical protein [Bacteroidota bacterium]